MRSKGFEDSAFSKWRRDLIRRKGGSLQKNFLHLLQDSGEFCRHLEQEVKIEPGSSPPLLKRQLTAANYQNPPADIEEWMFEQWQDITPAEACSSALWGWVTFRHIQEGIIKSHFLASNGGNDSEGKQRIARAIKEDNAEKIDAIIRLSLRRLCGLREPRGNRSVYSDCIFARAWWRNYLCREVCGATEADPNEVARLFRGSRNSKSQKEYWERLITFVVSRNSVLGDTKVRDALVWALSKRVGRDKNESPDILSTKILNKIVQLISIRSALQELGIFSIEELKGMMEQEFIARVA